MRGPAKFFFNSRSFSLAPILVQANTKTLHCWGGCVWHWSRACIFRVSDNKIHPFTCFSHNLSPSERNYDLENWELLAVKQALQEWWHWLDGVKQPFMVWADHKNLEYICAVKHAGLCSSTGFTSLSCRPGSKNMESALYLEHQREVEIEDFEGEATILPHNIVLWITRWTLECKVKSSIPDPSTIPAPHVLKWGHSSRLACHPEFTRTAFLVVQRFWWPTMSSDILVSAFVSSCCVCVGVYVRVLRFLGTPPAGLL